MPNKPDNNQPNTWLKYSSFAVQMGVTILIFLYIGRWVDDKMGNTTPYITLLGILIAIIGSLVKLIKDVQQ